MILFSKNNFIKKCPHCGIITEKYEGCNHITCSKCNYQWCWLCNEQYNVEHYRQGKCKGFQFYKPKNEKDIQLAFDGKIELNESQRQQDIEDNLPHVEQRRDIDNIQYDDFDFNRWRIRNFRLIRRNRSCFKCFRIFNRIILLLIYILFGQLFIQTNYSIMKLEPKLTWSKKIFSILVSLTYLFIILNAFFIQIFINIIILIPYLLIKGFSYFIKDFKAFLIMNSFDENDSVFYDISSFIFICILFIFRINIFLYFHRKNKNSKFISSCHYFITIIHMFIYFSFNIAFGMINLIFFIIYYIIHKSIKILF